MAIGQLVAAELVLVGDFYNLTRGIYYLELYYEFYAALTKLTQLVSVEPEKSCFGEDGRSWSSSIHFDNAQIVNDRGPLKFNFELPADSTVKKAVKEKLNRYAEKKVAETAVGQN